MPRYKHEELPASQTKPTELVLEALKTKLENNINIRRRAASKFRNDIKVLVHSYMSFCEQLRCQQSNLISEAFSHGSLADDILGNKKSYDISNGSRFLTDSGNLIISYWPKSAFLEDSPLDEDDNDLHKENIPHGPSTHIQRAKDDMEPVKEPVAGVEKRSLRPRVRRLRTYSKRKRESVFSLKQSQILSTEQQEEVVSSDVAGCKDKLISEFPPKRAKAWSQPLGLTGQLYIKDDEIRDSRSWVFSYTLDRKTAFYTIRCPADCPSPVFSVHPLYESRAQRHFENCNIGFENEEDMVRKYARQVVQSRNDRLITCKWVKWHNSTLLGKAETQAHSENIR